MTGVQTCALPIYTSIGFSFYLTPDGDEAAHLTCTFSLLVDQKSPMRP